MTRQSDARKIGSSEKTIQCYLMLRLLNGQAFRTSLFSSFEQRITAAPSTPPPPYPATSHFHLPHHCCQRIKPQLAACLYMLVLTPLNRVRSTEFKQSKSTRL
jgi:hypothetical protein